jgi:hypothetical protein
MHRSISRLGRCFVTLGFGFASFVGIVPVQAQELCGGTDYPFPYTDVSGVGAAFCPGIMEAYVTGVSKGTTPSTFSPNETVTRVQMTTFLQRSLDQALARASRRVVFNQLWTPQNMNSLQTIDVGGSPIGCAVDGDNIWVTNFGQVAQVQASTGKVLGTWTGAAQSDGVMVALGKVFVTGNGFPGSLYVIDPTQSPGPVTAVQTLGPNSSAIAFDGNYLWVANANSVSIIIPAPPYPTEQLATGFSEPIWILYDGANIWVTDEGAGTLLKLNSGGNVIQTVKVGSSPGQSVFDGANIWVPNALDNSITVVQASTGNVVATITSDASNQLSLPNAVSFDGERILVTNSNAANGTLSLFKAADLSFIANVTTGFEPIGPCSDAINFWIPLYETHNLLRF